MNAITKERIKLFIKNPLDNGLTRGEQMELARIALASLEAEAVMFCISGQNVDSEEHVSTSKAVVDAWVEEWNQVDGSPGEPLYKTMPLYYHAALPAPVVPDEMYWQDAPVEGSSKAAAYATGWNACRAAMLQSGNFRENKNSSTNNFREIAETSTNYPAIPSEVLSAILKVARIRADFDDFDGDRRGIGDCLDEAEQELIVTINKYASQLAAEPIATNDVREQTAVPPVPVIQADVAQAIEKLKRKLVECNRYNYCADAVKGVEYACRVLALQNQNMSAPIRSEAIENAIEYIRSIAFHIDEDDYHGKHIAYFMRQALAWLEGHSCSAESQGKSDNSPLPRYQVIELTVLVKQLVSQLKKAKPDCKLPDRAMDYLLRNGLVSAEGVLR